MAAGLEVDRLAADGHSDGSRVGLRVLSLNCALGRTEARLTGEGGGQAQAQNWSFILAVCISCP